MKPACRDPCVLSTAVPCPVQPWAEPSSGMIGSPERWTRGKRDLGKRTYFAKQGRWLPVGWGLGQVVMPPEPPSEQQRECGTSLQLPGRGGEENPAPAMGFSGHR